MTATTAPAPAPTLTIIATRCSTANRYRVTFTGPDRDAHAARYIEERGATHALHSSEGFDWEAYPLTAAALDPQCEHGLSATLCAGPGHYPEWL